MKKPTRLTKVLSLMLVLLLAAMSGCFEDPAEPCCSCMVENGCWSTHICPHEPMNSCLWVLGDGALPGYADVDWDVCYAVDADCANLNCSSECEGFTD